VTGPFGAQVLLLAGAKASVAPGRLPELVDTAATHLGDRREEYRRSYERAATVAAGEAGFDDDAEAFLVPVGHWGEVGDALALDARETDAVRRVHAEALRRVGRATGRAEEFETALEVREAVVVERG
jgi:hypothetical protein